MISKKLSLVAIGICSLVLAGGCSGSDEPAKGVEKKDDPLASVTWTDKTDLDAVEVDAKDNSFGPQHITVKAGTKVTFDNRGRNPHNVIPAEKGRFETVEVNKFQPGDTAERTFDSPGEFAYYCSLHGTATAGMTGAIKVIE